MIRSTQEYSIKYQTVLIFIGQKHRPTGKVLLCVWRNKRLQSDPQLPNKIALFNSIKDF